MVQTSRKGREVAKMVASILSSARRDFSEDHLWPTEPSVGLADEQSRPSASELDGMGKLLAELEKDSGDRPTTTTSEPRPFSAIKLSDLEANIRSAASKNKQPSLRKRTTRGFARFLIIFSMGIATTIAWQSHGDDIREMIAKSYPELGWLAPQPVDFTKPASEVAPTALATTSPDNLQLEAMSVSLAAVKQSVDQLAAQFVASQQQMASEVAKLKQDIAAGQQQMASDVAKLKQDIAASQQQMASDVAKLKQDIIASQQQTTSDVAKLKHDILAKISSAPRPVAAPARKPVPVTPSPPPLP
jgi:hypothetical protein